MSDVAVGTCEVHHDREAVARCESCGRGVCVACAVPVRGRVLCVECAAREVGEPAPERPTRRPSRVPDLVAGSLLALALTGTIPPWDRFGPSTGFLSAWRVGPSIWPLLSGVALVAATALALAPVAPRRRRPTAWSSIGYSSLAAVAAAATAWQVFGAPDYVSHTPAPFAVLILAVAAAVIGAVGAVRVRR